MDWSFGGLVKRKRRVTGGLVKRKSDWCLVIQWVIASPLSEPMGRYSPFAVLGILTALVIAGGGCGDSTAPSNNAEKKPQFDSVPHLALPADALTLEKGVRIVLDEQRLAELDLKADDAEFQAAVRAAITTTMDEPDAEWENVTIQFDGKELRLGDIATVVTTGDSSESLIDLDQSSDAVKRDLEMLSGTWEVTSGEQQLAERPSYRGIILKISGAAFEYSKDGQTTLDGTFRLDPHSSPNRLELILSDDELRFSAVYRFDGKDKLVICQATLPDVPVEEFTTSKSTKHILLHLKRLDD